MEDTKQNRTAVYLNVVPSTSQKNDDIRSNQIERELLSFCEKNKMHVDRRHIYRDMRFRFSGLDGFPSLCSLLQAANRHEFEFIVFNSTLGLPEGETLWEVHKALKASGAKVVFTNVSGELARQCKDVLGQILFVIGELERRIREDGYKQTKR